MSDVRVKAPATVANVVCGFDCLGFALDEPSDEMVFRRSSEPGVRIFCRGEFELPTDPTKNVAGVAALSMLAKLGHNVGVEIEIKKRIKPGSGIGSSSASAVGAVVGIQALFGSQFSKDDLLNFAIDGEMIASRSRHADNIAPCLLGGFTLVRSTDPIDIVEIDYPPLWATVLHPQIEIRTADSRALLPGSVELKTAVKQWANVGALVAAMSKGDYGLIARSLEDHIVESARKDLIPGFDAVKAAGIVAGALGGGISGSGPSVFMLSSSFETARIVEEAMDKAYESIGIEYNIHVSELSRNGALVLDRN